ncbi:MAG: hypothetical protein LCH56_08445 [Proteobacteria bacterium]|nr:hypothetical protein [Pseudomonadota bacterium]
MTSIAAHIAALLALLWLHIGPPPPRDTVPPQIIVNMMEDDAEPPGLAGDGGAPHDVAESAPVPAVAPEPVRDPIPANEPAEAYAPRAPDASDILSEAQLAGVANADDEGPGDESGSSGGGVGGCNTARVLQNALRRDPMVQNAVVRAGRAGKAVLLWDGDWVRAAEQDGRGLSGVRQALLWELAFAPEACRTKQMQGRVLLSLPDRTRFAIGTDHWRWSDLLGLVKTPADR